MRKTIKMQKKLRKNKIYTEKFTVKRDGVENIGKIANDSVFARARYTDLKRGSAELFGKELAGIRISAKMKVYSDVSFLFLLVLEI